MPMLNALKCAVLQSIRIKDRSAIREYLVYIVYSCTCLSLMGVYFKAFNLEGEMGIKTPENISQALIIL